MGILLPMTRTLLPPRSEIMARKCPSLHARRCLQQLAASIIDDLHGELSGIQDCTMVQVQASSVQRTQSR